MGFYTPTSAAGAPGHQPHLERVRGECEGLLFSKKSWVSPQGGGTANPQDKRRIVFRRITDDRSRRRGGRFVSLRCHSATLPAPRQLCQGGFAASGIGGVQKVSSAWIAPLLPARPPKLKDVRQAQQHPRDPRAVGRGPAGGAVRGVGEAVPQSKGDIS